MLKKILVISFSLLVLNNSITFASEILLPATGQFSCYDVTGAYISCTGTGQDGELRAGLSVSPRFTDNANGTVTDNLTGLVWLKDANCFGNHLWAEAIAFANNLANGMCNLTDGSSAGQWRLPNNRELQSLVDPSMSDPAISYPNYFLNIQWHLPSSTYSTYYWTSTNSPSNSGSVFMINMGSGGMTNNDKMDSFYEHYTWPVRNGN